MALLTYAAIEAALDSGMGQRAIIHKTTNTTVATGIYDIFLNGGSPSGATFGTPLTARVMTNASVGAVDLNNAGAGNNLYLVSFGAGAPSAGIGTLLLYDRLAEYPFNGTSTTGVQTFTSVTLPARDVAGGTAGIGVLPFVENYSASIASTAIGLTAVYTNSAGTGSQTSATLTLTAAALGVNRVTQSQLWFPLAAGDTGVQSIQSLTLSTSAVSTQMNIVLARPLCYLPVMTAGTWIERDMILQSANLPRLYDGTCLGILLIAATTSSLFQAHILMVEG